MTLIGSYKINMNSNVQNVWTVPSYLTSNKMKLRRNPKKSSSSIRAQLVEFQATRRMDVPFRQERLSWISSWGFTLAMTDISSYKINMNSNLQNVWTVPSYLTFNKMKLRRNPQKNSNIVRAQLIEFQATRMVDVPFRQGVRKGEDYIKETERIVKITFPDSSRINYLGDNVWRARLRPVIFFTVNAIPLCDVKVFHTNNSLQIASDRLVLDFKGLPGQNDGLHFQFSLQGELLVHRTSTSVLESEQTPSFRGWVTMGLKVDLPLPLSLMPDYIILPVGNGILDRILGAMEGELASRIIKDYSIWCHVSTQLTGTVPQLSPP